MEQQFEYDYMEEIDTLEVFFERGAATCAVELTDHITLRFRYDGERKAMSLILENVSYLTQMTETGPQSFRLKLDRLPDELRQTVVCLITQPPVNRFLKVSTYTTPRAKRSVPIAYVEKLTALAA